MKAVIQRVRGAKLTADGVPFSESGAGMLILLGVCPDDTEKEVDFLVRKCANIRIFEDENGKMNRSVNDVQGNVLAISNFTLCANYRHGNRPDYIRAEKPQRANELYEYFVAQLRTMVEGGVQMGMFGADMKISSALDGPVTIVMDSKVLSGEV